MYNLYVKSDQAGTILKTELDAIWYVNADRSYNVSRKPSLSENAFVAVRTLQGSGKLTTSNDLRFFLQPNSLGIFDLNLISQYSACSQGWLFYWFEFKVLEGALKFVNWVAEIPVVPQERAYMEHCCMGMGSQRDCEHFLSGALFNYLIADWQDRATWAEGKIFSVQQLLALLEKGRSQKMSVAEMAKEAGMCERSFRNSVHSVTGYSPKEYMRKMDMDIAIELLRTTNMTIADISDNLHYTNPFYFSRVFKSHYGISPQKAREKLL